MTKETATAAGVLIAKWRALYEGSEDRWRTDGDKTFAEFLRIEAELEACPSVCICDAISKLEIGLEAENYEITESAIADLRRMNQPAAVAA